MTGLHALWIPILVSAVIVFLASSLIHMVLPWHKGDFSQVPNEDKVMDALRPFSIPPGDYMLPRPSSMGDMKSAEFHAKMTKGPVMIFTAMPNGPGSMGKSLVMWFLYSVIVGVFAGYVAGRALPVGAAYLHVFRFAGVTTFVAYALGTWQASIWYHRKWSTTMIGSLDALIYALLTAGTFGWLWPR